jgi:hypothetical protein
LQRKLPSLIPIKIKEAKPGYVRPNLGLGGLAKKDDFCGITAKNADQNFWKEILSVSF